MAATPKNPHRRMPCKRIRLERECGWQPASLTGLPSTGTQNYRKKSAGPVPGANLGALFLQNAWRTPMATPLCEPPAAGAPPAAALLTEMASAPSLAMCPAVAYTDVRLDRW